MTGSSCLPSSTPRQPEIGEFDVVGKREYLNRLLLQIMPLYFLISIEHYLWWTLGAVDVRQSSNFLRYEDNIRLLCTG